MNFIPVDIAQIGMKLDLLVLATRLKHVLRDVRQIAIVPLLKPMELPVTRRPLVPMHFQRQAHLMIYMSKSIYEFMD